MAAAPSRPDDPFNALTSEDVRVAGSSQGALAGLTFVAKDLYDVAGYATGAGSPAWAETHGAAEATAPAVAALIEAGASLVAKSHTDELAWSLLGQNAHYGTPTNPRNPDRVPGGSSSGSVVATAGALVDFAVGSDTGGSVRVPASNCGVYGVRTTHGAISTDGIVPLAPSFDTVGWFAREAELFAAIGGVLLERGLSTSGSASPGGGVIADDAFDVADKALARVLQPAVERVAVLVGGATSSRLSSAGLDEWASAWRTIQARDVWRAHGAWVTEHDPSFGPGIRERFEWARTLSDWEEQEARAVQDAARRELAAVLSRGRFVLLPAAAAPAPKLDASAEELERYRTATMKLTCSAGLGGMPQITLPAGELDGCPVGLGVLGPAGSDLELLALARRYETATRGD